MEVKIPYKVFLDTTLKIAVFSANYLSISTAYENVTNFLQGCRQAGYISTQAERNFRNRGYETIHNELKRKGKIK